ncbi:prostacyclin receptor [Cloeon dipterum]|uniref:prostacyclin receptor n=1 Tax=Cloeon dipterum TaxID=197152 RepID=UPI00322064B6
MVGSVLPDVTAEVRWTLNATSFLEQLENATEFASIAPSAAPRRHLGVAMQAIITASYVLGVVGNGAALVILSREKKRPGWGRNTSKHHLMLRCLAGNDLVALLGMLVLMHAQLYLPPGFTATQGYCAARLMMRVFGLGSGMVALVMAAERWLALSHPFVYQQHVTYHLIQRSIFTLWALVVLLVSLPLFGFGMYYKPGPPVKCERYRQANDPAGIAYAYLFFTFGSLLCLAIVGFNLAVVRALCSIGRRSMLDRRVSSRSSSNTHHSNYRSLAASKSLAATPEELAFVRLMTALCVIFLVCWMPQMIAIPVSRMYPNATPLLRIADVLMSFHFSLDPYIYVLLRCRRRPCVQAFLKVVCRSSSFRHSDHPVSDHPSKHTTSDATTPKTAPRRPDMVLEHRV